MKCKYCEYFDKQPVKGWGDCSNEEIFQDASNFISAEPTEKTLFRYSDLGGYGAHFQVHENFGCVGFKESS